MTKDTLLQLSEDVVYRKVGDELVLIEASSGRFYHFTSGSKDFFDFLQQPRSLGTLAGERDPKRSEQISQLVTDLVEKQVLRPSEGEAALGETPAELPHLIRVGEERLESVRFLY